MVLLLFAFGWLLLGERDWFVQPRSRGYAILVTVGVALAAIVEWIAGYWLGRWAYSDAMPKLPRIGVGLVPMLQMVVLPPLIFWLAAARLRRQGSVRS